MGRHAGPPGGLVFFFNDTATTEIYTLSLHDALPISLSVKPTCIFERPKLAFATAARKTAPRAARRDRKSTRLNSSHTVISYAVFCLKKKKENGDADARLSCVGVPVWCTVRMDVVPSR